MAARTSWIRPPALRPGDRVGVVAPAGPVAPGTLDKGLAVLRQMGFEPVEGKHVRGQKGFLAAEDADRAADFLAMVRDPGIRGIVCARGGYGANRILPLLKPAVLRKNPKVVVGSSDLTLLLVYLTQRCRLIAWHGPMAAASFGSRSMPQSRKQFARALTGDPRGAALQAPQARVLASGQARGRLAGGNLTLLARSLGTPYEIDTRGSILLIEDVNEPPYRLDGLLWQLKHAGKLKALKGVVIGEMVGCRFPKGQRGSLDALFLDHLGGKGIPILANCPIGHGHEIWTLPIGGFATLDTRRRSLELETVGVS